MTPARWEALRTYLIEAQTIFVPAVTAILLDVGLEIIHVADRLDFRTLVELSPDVVFADLDFIQTDPRQSLQILRTLLPQGIILMYSTNVDEEVQKEFRACGADVVLSKSFSRTELVRAIQEIISSNGSHVA